MLYNFHKCNNELKDSIICEECHKMISLKYVEKHVQTCKIEDCLFIHVDGRQCEHVKHNKLIHRNFINNTNVTEDKESTFFKKFNKQFEGIILSLNTIFGCCVEYFTRFRRTWYTTIL